MEEEYNQVNQLIKFAFIIGTVWCFVGITYYKTRELFGQYSNFRTIRNLNRHNKNSKSIEEVVL